MPLLMPTDLRHPINQERALHAAALEVVGAGGFIAMRTMVAFVKAGTAVKQRRDAVITIEDMEDRLMLSIEKGGVRIAPAEDMILPPGWLDAGRADELSAMG